MPILEVSGYTKNFHIHHLDREIAVFQSLDFTLREGEFLLVAGPNGIGKSTLLRCLYRSYRPTIGQALYHSKYGVVDLARAADVDISVLRREEIGFVTQFLRPRPRVSALELVAETVGNTGGATGVIGGSAGGQSAIEQAEAMLLEFGLKPELWHAYPATFSGGEQQKVNLARALIRPRRLLLLDEPTASLDAATRDSLARKLGDLKAKGVAMIGVFHHPEDVAHLIDDEIRLNSSAMSMNGQGAAYDVVE